MFFLTLFLLTLRPWEHSSLALSTTGLTEVDNDPLHAVWKSIHKVVVINTLCIIKIVFHVHLQLPHLPIAHAITLKSITRIVCFIQTFYRQYPFIL